MRTTLLFALLTVAFSASAQDIINKKNGDKIQSKIEAIDQSSVKYKNFNDADGPSKLLEKSEILDIRFENGMVQYFTDSNITKGISKTELQHLITKAIDEHGFDQDTFDRHCKATFHGDYLHIVVLKQNGEPINRGFMHDFSNVFRFEKVSERSEKLAFINIILPIAKDKDFDWWKERKLVMRVDDPTVARQIVSYLKDYNAMIAKDKPQK